MTNFIRYLIIFFVACLLFFAFLGQVHLFDWDEINFAECAREMIVSKDYLRAQIDYMPFWEKPPFFIWMEVLSMKIFGVSEFAARFPDAFTGVVTLLFLYYAGKKVMNEKLATWWVLLYAACWLPHFYFKSGIIDPIFNFFIILSFFQAHLIRFSRHKMLHALLGGLFLGLAVLTKGPVALLIAMLSFIVYMVVNRGLNGFKLIHLIVIAFCAGLPMLVWLGLAVAHYGENYGKWFITEFITYQVRLFQTEDSDHGGPFYYHFIVLLFGCFPGSVFLFQYAGRRITTKPETNDFAKWMWALFWVVLILFSIVKTKIVHYSSLCYFPLTFLAALWIYRLSNEPVKLKKGVKALLLTVGSLIALLLIALPIAGINKEKLIPYINDPFFAGNLQANVSWNYAECLIGLIYLVGIRASVYIMNKDFRRGMIVLCVIQIFIIQGAILHFTPKIEAISQRAAIEYFKNFEGMNVYVQPLGYKSYANLFYTKKQPGNDSSYIYMSVDHEGRKMQPVANEKWLLTGKLDKPAYFICKIQDEEKFRKLPQLQEIGGSNGFVFFKRK